MHKFIKMLRALMVVTPMDLVFMSGEDIKEETCKTYDTYFGFETYSKCILRNVKEGEQYHYLYHFYFEYPKTLPHEHIALDRRAVERIKEIADSMAKAGVAFALYENDNPYIHVIIIDVFREHKYERETE